MGSSQVATKFEKQYNDAPRNRKDLFRGTVNYHWRSDDGKRKGNYTFLLFDVFAHGSGLGWMVAQDKDKAGFSGTSTIHVRQVERNNVYVCLKWD